MLRNVVPSADGLIGEIRDMYNRTRKSKLNFSCELINKKVERRKMARKKAMEKLWNKESDTENSIPTLSEATEEPRTRASKIGTYEDRDPSKHSTGKNITSGSIHRAEKGGIGSKVSGIPVNYSTAVATWKPSRYGVLPKAFDAVGDRIYHTFGEIVLQLERRVILHVFPDADRIYYGTLGDIRGVIWSEPDVEKRARYTRALKCRIERLELIGWDVGFHVQFGSQIMQKYGVGAPALLYDDHDPLVTHAQLARLIAKKLALSERVGMLTILSGLLSLALEDGQPLFVRHEGEEFDPM